jgi:two-component system, NarL family, response regulator NreC
MTAAIRVLLAEDHETVRDGLKLLLQSQPDIEVVGEVADGQAAVDRAQRLKPHVVIMDLSMPGMNGLSATRMLKQNAPDVAVVALTRHDDEAYVKELLGAGASGYVLKQSSFSELLRAVRAAAAGGRYLDAALAGRADEGSSRRRLPIRPAVTEREAHVLRLMALGHSNKEIADQLGIAVKTVEVHKANGMRKLGLRGRIDVVRYAVLNGWLQET